jgi:hypothetical protein
MHVTKMLSEAADGRGGFAWKYRPSMLEFTLCLIYGASVWTLFFSFVLVMWNVGLDTERRTMSFAVALSLGVVLLLSAVLVSSWALPRMLARTGFIDTSARKLSISIGPCYKETLDVEEVDSVQCLRLFNGVASSWLICVVMVKHRRWLVVSAFRSWGCLIDRKEAREFAHQLAGVLEAEYDEVDGEWQWGRVAWKVFPMS